MRPADGILVMPDAKTTMAYTVKQVAKLSNPKHECKTERKRPITAQKIIRHHCQWLKQFWTPSRESYAGNAEMTVDSELRKAYEAHDPALPEFAAAAMKAFAAAELA